MVLYNKGGEYMPIDYQKRKETHIEKKAWIPRELYREFELKISNFQGWVNEKIKEEVDKEKNS